MFVCNRASHLIDKFVISVCQSCHLMCQNIKFVDVVYFTLLDVLFIDNQLNTLTVDTQIKMLYAQLANQSFSF